MNAAGKLLFQQFIYQTVAFDPRLAGKGFRNDQHAEMAVSRVWRTSMSCVSLRLVDDVKSRRAEPKYQLFPETA